MNSHFFFSSRRRHTRWPRDWSSDVCSSDLMGGGITVGAHEKGRVIDVNDGLYGDGPMSPTRSGALPNRAFAKYILDNQLTLDEISTTISKQGGFISLKGTEDALQIEREALDGDQYSMDIYRSLSVQIAKEIGSRATLLKGDIDGILFTGGLAHSKFLIDLRSEERRVGKEGRSRGVPGHLEKKRKRGVGGRWHRHVR